MNTYRENRINDIVKRRNIANVFAFSLALMIVCVINFPVRKLLSSDAKAAMILVAITFFVSLVFCVLSLLLSRRNFPELFRAVADCFWMTFFIIYSVLVFMSQSRLELFANYVFMTVMIGLIPVLQKEEFRVFVGLEVVDIILIAIITKSDAESICFLTVFAFVCSLLSFIRHKNFVLNMGYKTKLTSAIRMSETDKMTGLLNRRGLERCVESLWPHWMRERTTVAFLMIDIDYFKKYNDEYGHMMGDECIIKVAKKISKSIRRKTDFAARVGGEEFLICLSGIEGKDSILWAKHLKSSIEAMEIPHAHNNFLPCVTVSMGLVCDKPFLAKDFDKMYDDADKSLYDAKEFGRACIVYNKRCYDQRFISDYKQLQMKTEKFG